MSISTARRRGVSNTEDSLARALRDAAAAARPGDSAVSAPNKIGDGERLKAMAVLQEARPELSHSKLIAIIERAAVGGGQSGGRCRWWWWQIPAAGKTRMSAGVRSHDTARSS